MRQDTKWVREVTLRTSLSGRLRLLVVEERRRNKVVDGVRSRDLETILVDDDNNVWVCAGKFKVEDTES